MRVRVLGPVGIWTDEVEVPVPAGKPRALLAMLALADGKALSVDQLVEGLWGEDAAVSASTTLQVHVSTLRSRLRQAGGTIASTGRGYKLEVEPDEIDAVCFERLAEKGFAALNEERPDVASRFLQAALDEWSGEPLANALDTPFAAHEADRLSLRRLAVFQARIDADLSLGLGITLVDETRSLAAANPYNERMCGQLMIALYRAGQAAAALDACQALRAVLLEDLGLDVGPELVELERQILVHDDRLLAQPGGKTAKRSNLPQEVSRFIGREAESRIVRESIKRSRLTTITGAGGAGKTRLALTVAGSLLDEFSGGVWMVELAPLLSRDTIEPTLAEVVGVRADGGLDAVAEHIGERPLLLVVDNCEHVIDEVARIVHDLLRRCTHLRVLATSREALAIDGEQVYRLPSLDLVSSDTTDLDAICGCDAVRFFADRASLQNPDFLVDAGNATATLRICRRLDGMPLAIELAAARLRTIPIDELAQRLDQRFNVLAGAGRQVLARQQTLQALIDWSYDLLSEGERQILRRLSVFVGGFSVDAAEAICIDLPDTDVFAVVTTLVDKSLVESDMHGSGRFRLLETIRQYAAQSLAQNSTESEMVQLAHARYYLQLAESAAPSLELGHGQLQWLDRLDVEHDNLRAAATAFSRYAASAAEGLRLAWALLGLWDLRSHCVEGAAISEAMLAHPAAEEDTEEYVLALCAAADMFERAGDIVRASQLADQAARLAPVVGTPGLVVQVAMRTSMLAGRRGEFQLSLELLAPHMNEQRPGSLAIRLPMGRAFALFRMQRLLEARADLDDAATAARVSGNDGLLGTILYNLSCVDLAEGDLASASHRLQQAQELAARIGDRDTLRFVNANLGLVAVQTGDYPRAYIHYRDGLLLNPSGNDPAGVMHCLLGLALCSYERGDVHDAAVLHGFIDEMESRESGIEFDPPEVALRQDHRERIRESTGEMELLQRLDVGRRLNLVEAIELALGHGAAGSSVDLNVS